MCDQRNNETSSWLFRKFRTPTECAINITMKRPCSEFDSTREVYNQNKQVARFHPVEVCSLKCFHWQYLITVRTMSWMPDPTVFCPLFSWLKWHFIKMPPARILQSGVLVSKVVNAFSQEIIKVREWIPHIGPLTRVIHLNLFLDMVPSSCANFT